MPDFRFAERVHRIKPSFTLDMAGRAAEMRNSGQDVINFSVGEPDFNTPEHIRAAAVAAMEAGFTKYTAGTGMLELRQAICTKFLRENDLAFTPDQILVSNGEKQSLYTACQALFQAGDEVIVLTPYWVSFPEFIRLADAEPVFVATNPEQNFEPDWADLESKLTPKIKGVIINSPSNPTGGVWSDEAVTRILELAADRGWTVISDECYERLVFDRKYVSAEKLNRFGAQIITCMSLSKTYAMTGWRIGYAAGPDPVIKAMGKLQGQATSCANSIGQKAAVAALLGDQSPVDEMCWIYKKRRDLIVGLLNKIPGVRCANPGGAFYAFPDMSAYLGKKSGKRTISNSFDLSDYLLEAYQVVTVAGDGFGAPGHVRFSYATGFEQIQVGLDRVTEALTNLA